MVAGGGDDASERLTIRREKKGSCADMRDCVGLLGKDFADNQHQDWSAEFGAGGRIGAPPQHHFQEPFQ